MPSFKYIGPYARLYPEILTADGSLQVEPGDVRDLPEAPADGYWVKADAAKAAPSAVKEG